MLTQELIQLGFSEKEALAYVVLYQMGPSPASTLARRSRLKRATIYAVLDALLARGMVSFEELNGCRRYIAHSPECIIQQLEQEQISLKSRISLAKECAEKLQRVGQTEASPSQMISFYRGIISVEKALNENLHNEAPIYVLYLNIGDKSLGAQSLHRFLSQTKQSRLITLFVPESQRELAQKNYPLLRCQGAPWTSPMNGGLLVQENKVFFMLSKESELQMMCIKDSSYSNYFKDLLFDPISS